MAFINDFKSKLQKGGKFISSAARASGRFVGKAGKALYKNRDLVSRAASTGLVLGTSAISGGGVGLGLGLLSQKDNISQLSKDIKDRLAGKTTGGDIDPAVKRKLVKGGLEAVRKYTRPKDPEFSGGEMVSRSGLNKSRMKTLAQGDSV